MTHEILTANDISTAMETLGLNQPRFADALGVDQGTVSKWVNGKVSPSVPVRKLIAMLLDEHGNRKVHAEAAE